MLRFQVKSRKASIGKKKGQVLFFAHKQASRRITLEQVEESITRSTTLTRGDVRAAIASLTDVVNEAILRGDSVDLGDLGTLRVSVGAKQMDKEEDVNASTLRKPQVRYSPKKAMRLLAKTIPVSVFNPKAKGSHLGDKSSSVPSTTETHHESASPNPKETVGGEHSTNV